MPTLPSRGHGQKILRALCLGTGRGPAAAGWLGLLCVLGATYVSVLAGGPRAVLVVAAVLAAAATVTFGGWFGYRRDWPNLGKAVLAGTLVLVGWVEIAWIASFFIPVPGGSGGMLEILAPAFYAVIVGVLGSAGLAVILGAGALVVWVTSLLRPFPRRAKG
jgi:hypothetical protein